MELINATRMVAGFTMGLEPSGRELLVVVVKGTFQIPDVGGPVRLAEEQRPLVMADTFSGEPGFSAPIDEVDFAPRKHRCDVLVTGNAHAPRGRPVTRLEVDLQAGDLRKRFAVLGDRYWLRTIGGATASTPASFVTMPVSYDRAFGGFDDRHEDPSQHAALMRNPVGRGFHKHLKADWLDGAPLPNTEELHRHVSDPTSTSYLPMALGPIGRNWEPRSGYAGTFDDAWLADHFPFLPPDFDEQYYQAAPDDQQIPFPRGGETIRLTNMSTTGDIAFTLPTFNAPTHFFPKQGPREDAALVLDTIVLRPEDRQFSLTWRATRPLKRNMFEVRQILVGKRSRDWWSQRERVEFPIPLLALPFVPRDRMPPSGGEA
jgi:hypothetical protein